MTSFNIPSLRDKGITVHLSRRLYNPYKYDSAATEAAETQMGTHRAGRFSKRLLRNCVELKRAQQAYNTVYDFVIQNTLPWMDDGVRVLPNDLYLDFCQGVAQRKAAAEQAVKGLYEVWDQAVAKDRDFLGNMWNFHDYPTKEDMMAKWGIRITFAPIPTSTDFRIDMDDEDKRQLDEAVQEVQDQAGEYLLKEILKPVAAMADKLAVPIGAEGAIFRDSLVTNLQEVAARAKKLNINDDSRVSEIVGQIEKITKNVTPNTLRESQAVRSMTSQAMASMRTKISQYF